MPSILIAEDHSVVRMGAIMLIRELYPDSEIEEAETFDEALNALDRKFFDLLLLDIHIPGGDNLQMIEAVHLRKSGLAILIFSSYEEHLYALRYMQAGARGYLQKRSAPEEIKKAIQAVLNGGKYMSSEIHYQLLDRLLGPDKKREDIATLSNREMEVMQLLINGAAPSEIKATLRLKDSTISTHKSRIFEKLKVSSVVELAEKIRMLNMDRKN